VVGDTQVGQLAASAVYFIAAQNDGMAPDLLDGTYERLSITGPEYGGGLSNHGPMAAEALLRLGRGDAIEGWVTQYMRGLEDAVRSASPITDADWREALGDLRRVADWEAFLDRELQEGPWRDVLARWWARLLPGISAGATHGVIRTAHAVRALGDGETPERVAELGRGLAYWAARYLELPGRPRTAGTASLNEAVRQVPLLVDPPAGLISTRFAALDRVDGFAAAVERLEPPADVPAALDALTVAFAGAYLARGHEAPIPYIHGVTAPAAVRLALPKLPVALWRPSYDAIWQVGAAIQSAYGAGPSRPLPSGSGAERDGLIDRAVATNDEHAIKFTEACLRQHNTIPNPLFLLAAEDAIDRLG
jgi:hypothetical protein